MNNTKNKILIYASLVLGGGSLIYFYLFLFFGPYTLISFTMELVSALILDAFLCLLFFFQHSVLIRKSVREKFSARIPDLYYSAFYSITSGIALFIMLLFWQRTVTIATAEGLFYWLLRALFVLSIAGFYRGITALGTFDPFGTVKIKRSIKNRETASLPLSVKGPYLWIRHPLYFFSLIMIWASPNLTIDKLLFNIMWTLWIFIAAMLEERDLTREFGNSYREYQKQVPMLIPYKIPHRK